MGISFRLSQEEQGQLRAAAELWGCTIADALRRAIADALARATTEAMKP